MARGRDSAPSSDRLLTGVHSISEALAGKNRTVEEIWVLRGPRNRTVSGLLARARRQGVVVREGGREALAGLQVGPARLVARCGPFRYERDVDLPRAGGAAAPSLVVVLDRVQDPQNLGAIIRTAEAAGATALCLPKRRAVGITAAVVRASAGATEHLPIHRVVNVARTVRRLRELGYWTVALDLAASTPWDAVDYTGGVALVLGSEGRGLRPLVARTCDHQVRLPMAGRIGSLNVSAAFAAVAYEVLRQQRGGAR